MMQQNNVVSVAVLVLAVTVVWTWTATPSRADQLGTGFSYQGQLLLNDGPTNGDFDFEFNLYLQEDPFGATPIATITELNVPVTNSQFTVELDFGLDVFDGTAYWLEVRVRPAGSGGLISLFPLHKITAVPYSLRSLVSTDSDALNGMASTDFVSGSGGSISGDLTVSGTLRATSFTDGAGAPFIGSCAAGSSIRAVGANGTVTCESDDVGAPDNLGNHSATQTIALNNNWITNDGVADGDGIFIQNSGQVGIGTSNPLNALHVIGFIRFTEVGSGGTDLCRNSSRVLSFCSSSQRYKKNIADYLGGLDIVEQLRPVMFDWKQDDQHDLGLIAEEVAEIDPLLVTHRDDNEIEGVKYKQLTIVLVNALKEQQAQIEQLRSLVCVGRPESDLCR